MIFCHKPYYNPNYTKSNKKSLSDICPKPKKNTNYANYIMQNKQIQNNIGKNLETKT
jgi:hypothetical protein